jgi:HK97 family phage major capsid protein
MSTTMSRTDRLLDQQGMVHTQMKQMLDAATRETRALSADEEKRFADLKAQHDALEHRLEQLQKDDDFRAGLDRVTDGAYSQVARGDGGSRLRADSWGAQFLAGIGDFFKKGQHRTTAAWSTPMVELQATTITESASPIVPPMYLPGIQPGPTPPVVMSNLFAGGIATSNAVVFMKETLFTNPATAVAEGALKPEAALTFAPVTTALTKIPCFIPISDEMLEDQPQMSSYLDARLRLMVMLALDDELLSGSGVAPHMNGLLVRTDLAPAIVTTGNGLDSIATQIADIENAQGLPVTGIAMNGADWLNLGLLKTTQGAYLMGSPFDSAGPNTLWGRAVAVSPKVPKGTAVVGAFKSGGGMLFQRGGISVLASNSHSDFFIRNLVALRAEVRAAMCLFRPASFGLVTGLP